ncbi:nucleoside diphosphate kinase [Mariniphaga anaerophila]|uniref:Nucleoside diphosphate kinase n=1 Tax=Mariniphaga anaerophila TaxID=1484053 RepID=A0A1M4T270_9BACT|nr:nucleoside-diphosphate kinase [Mariniphaga anaerophila]SHE38612.1 nucleoside diphosphate kinase [Mariniphaga anaerophila]
MAGNQTFTMIKPTAFKKNYAGAILKMITEAGFQVKAMKLTRLTTEQAGAFYAVHKGKPFYQSLVDFMSSGPIVAIILEKENAVQDFRNFIGATNPENAAEGTVRKLYATSLQENAVHGSDSDENAIIEADFFFSKQERF